VLQVGVRQTSREETLFAASDSRVDVWYARDLFSPCGGSREWDGWIKALTELRGVVHLTLDVDGLDGSLVPATGTPVPGGLAFWQAIETIETLFANPDVYVTSADVCEIVPDPHSNLTEFTAALLATKIVAAHLAARQAGRWNRY
jgi:agmatinase